MSFFRCHKIRNYRQIKKQAFLRAKVFIKNIFITCLRSIKTAGKRMSFFPSPHYKASMAVEASLVIPFFLFFMLNILFSLDILRLHGNLTGALHQTGNQMAFAGYVYGNIGEKALALPEELSSVVMSEGYARAKVVGILGPDYLNHTCLTLGTSGLHFTYSSVMEKEDMIDLIVSYKVKPFIRILGFPDISMENRYYGRAWTGYDVLHGQDNIIKGERVVFITETGSAYHEARNCTYLCPSIQMIPAISKEDARNENGGRYDACERCGGDGLQAALYITSDGNRYHNTLKCPGLKRTVYAVKLSEAKDKSACFKCTGNR